jgi:hypothetical protein
MTLERTEIERLSAIAQTLPRSGRSFAVALAGIFGALSLGHAGLQQ